MALRDALDNVGKAIKDLSSLHVQTYTGTVEIDLDNVPADKQGIDHVRDTVKTAKGDGTIVLVAEAYFQFDGDSYNFLTNADVPPRALEMHTAAVEAGLKTRRGLADLVKGVFD